jgi:hypothetical protein
MRIQTAFLSCLLALAAGVPSAVGQVFVVTATPLSFTPNNPSHQISLGLTISGNSGYTLVGVSFDLQLGGSNPTTQTVPTITSVVGNLANFPGTQISVPDGNTQWLKSISMDWTSKPLTAPVTTPIEFAVVTVDASSFSSGSWPFSVTAIEFNDSADLNTPIVASSFNGTLSAVPEPEETMAVMAGLSLGLGWWIRRRRAKGAHPAAPGCKTGLVSR